MNIKKVLILGSNSFSGSHCVNFFLENTSCKVIGISRSQEYSATFLPYLYKKKKRPNRFIFHQLDINKDLRQIINLIDSEKPEVIINFAAQGNVQYSWTNPEHWFKTNCLGIANLSDNLKNKDYLKKYIQVSTPEVYGPCENFKENLSFYNPTTPYAASKAAGDLFLSALFKKYNFPVSFIRSTNVYGIHQQLYRIMPRSVIYVKKGWKIPLHNGGEIMRSFLHISDVIEGIYKVIMKGKNGEAYHFSSEPISIKNLVQTVCTKIKADPEGSVEFSAARNPDHVYDLNCDKAKKELGWKPKISLDNGIKEVVGWINNNWVEIVESPLEYIHKE